MSVTRSAVSSRRRLLLHLIIYFRLQNRGKNNCRQFIFHPTRIPYWTTRKFYWPIRVHLVAYVKENLYFISGCNVGFGYWASQIQIMQMSGFFFLYSGSYEEVRLRKSRINVVPSKLVQSSPKLIGSYLDEC